MGPEFASGKCPSTIVKYAINGSDYLHGIGVFVCQVVSIIESKISRLLGTKVVQTRWFGLR